MTHHRERMSETEKMPPKVTKDDWAHPDRIAWIKESTDTLSSFGGHVVHDLADAITQLRTDLAAANERAERAETERGQRDGLIDDLTTKLCAANEQIDTLRTQLAEAESVLSEVEIDLFNVNELNPDNYTHDEVCELNSKMIEIYLWVKKQNESRLTRDAAASLKNPESSGSNDADASGEGVGDVSSK